jgi:hypothetical protein
MPRDGARRWKRWIPGRSDAHVEACFDAHGLYYETYIYENDDGTIDEAETAKLRAIAAE